MLSLLLHYCLRILSIFSYDCFRTVFEIFNSRKRYKFWKFWPKSKPLRKVTDELNCYDQHNVLHTSPNSPKLHNYWTEYAFMIVENINLEQEAQAKQFVPWYSKSTHSTYGRSVYHFKSQQIKWKFKESLTHSVVGTSILVNLNES